MCLVSASVSENDVFQSLVVYTNITFVFFSLHSLSLRARAKVACSYCSRV